MLTVKTPSMTFNRVNSLSSIKNGHRELSFPPHGVSVCNQRRSSLKSSDVTARSTRGRFEAGNMLNKRLPRQTRGNVGKHCGQPTLTDGQKTQDAGGGQEFK